MEKVLCYAAVHDGRIRRSSLEIISHFADTPNVETEAVLVDPKATDYAGQLARYGASRVHIIDDESYATGVNVSLIESLCHAFRSSGASVLAFGSTEAAKDVLGALGIRLDASVLPDVSAIDLVDGEWEARRPVMAAKRSARVRATARPVIVSVRSGSYQATEAPANLDVVTVSMPDADTVSGPELQEVITTTGGTVDLGEARVVVSAGRGVKDDEGARLVAELASVTGAAVGATRAVVESGLYPATAQIGQTGKVVSPELYFALGISGAIQHVAGIVNSRVIVAVNKDADAPIFGYSTYGIVGDLYKVVPEIVRALKRAGSG